MVYPSLAILLMLMRGLFSPGRMSVSLALLLSCLKGSWVLYDACSLVLSGNYTSLFDFPFFGKFISSGTKFDVAPKSMTNFSVNIILPSCQVSVTMGPMHLQVLFVDFQLDGRESLFFSNSQHTSSALAGCFFPQFLQIGASLYFLHLSSLISFSFHHSTDCWVLSSHY